MSYAGPQGFQLDPFVAGGAYDAVNEFFGRGKKASKLGGDHVIAARSPLEENLLLAQDAISEISMHLPKNFARGLSRQFANLMDEDAWEDEDEPIHPNSITTFLMVLVHSGTKRRPGIGTNGQGSITASWVNGKERLIIECLPSGNLTVLLSRSLEVGETERASFVAIKANRLFSILTPFEPSVWFGC